MHFQHTFIMYFQHTLQKLFEHSPFDIIYNWSTFMQEIILLALQSMLTFNPEPNDYMKAILSFVFEFFFLPQEM